MIYHALFYTANFHASLPYAMFEQMFEHLFAVCANMMLPCQRGKEFAYTI
jgi:hypothetical protein